jgi:uncharacterized membrane protein (UPF0127 family)
VSTRRVAAVALLVCASAHAAEPARLLADFGRGRAIIETRTACHLLDLWFALTPEQRSQGLMNIRELGEYEGMLFVSRQPAMLRMWMKNTYVSLDMLFIRGDGRIESIAARTSPFSEATISSDGEVTAVLELNGGFAERHGVARGDRFEVLE